MLGALAARLWDEGDVSRLVTRITQGCSTRTVSLELFTTSPTLTREVASGGRGDFPLNPIEAYRRATTSRAGLCFEAYSGGREAARNPGVARRYGRRTPNKMRDLEQEADFEALRALHGRLPGAIEPWRSDEGELYLIDDQELRRQLIGDLASSHHWDLEIVVSRFATPRPPALRSRVGGGFPQGPESCGRRPHGQQAHRRFYRVLQMNSLSRAHWRARETHGQDAASDCVHIAAWWVAFDLIDSELVLKSSPGGPRHTFARRSRGRIGVASKSSSSTSKLRIGNLRIRLYMCRTLPQPTWAVSSFMGRMLIASMLPCALIQNAADVGVRRPCREFAGRIFVR